MTINDEYEQAQHDFYDTVRGVNPDGVLDESKGERYVKGWKDAETTFNLMGQPRTIDDVAAAIIKGKNLK
jgi:hypothetical protein